MTNKISVTKEFMSDFKEYCAIYQFNDDEIEELKSNVRNDMEKVGGFISKAIRVYRWLLKEWGGVPEYSVLEEYLSKRKVPIVEHRFGVMLLAELCYDLH